VKSKLLLLALGVGAAGFAMAQTRASDTNANNQAQRNSDTTATAPADQNGASIQSNPSMAATPMQSDDDSVVRNLNQASFDNRKDVLSEVDSRIGKAHRSAMKVEVKNVFHKESADMKTEYKAAKEDEKAARTDVKSRLKEAKDSTADNWESNRTALAQAYQRYCQAVAKVDSFAPNKNEDASNPSSTSDQNAQSQNAPASSTAQGDQSTTPASSSSQPQQ